MQVSARWLVLAVLAMAAAAWWFSRDTPEQARFKQQRAEQAAADIAEAKRPVVYRWRDADGVLHITSAPPSSGPYERIHTDIEPASQVRGDRR
jgi:hypothetical protein